MARAEIFVGVRRVRAGISSSPLVKVEPGWLQLAPRCEGMALRAMSVPASSNSTCSMAMAVSNPAGIAVPVFAQA